MRRRARHVSRWFVGPLLLASCFSRHTTPQVMVVDPAIPAEHRALLEKHLAPFPHKVQVAIALVKDGSTVFLGAERTPEGLRKVDNRTGVFEIGSITKVFTATLFAQEVTKGNLKMDDPVQPFLPFRLNVSGRDGTEMTLKHLASHTAGFKHHQPPGLSRHAFFHAHRDDPYRCFDEARFEAYLREDLELVSRPGAEYHYSNLGMSLLAKILMLRSGKSYETLLQERIFGPLGMSSSTTEIAKVRARVVQGVRGRGEAAPTTNMNALAPSGGILTCAEDMARFARTQFAPADSALALTQQPVFTIEPGYSVALGWHLVDRTNGERWINHNGGMEGYTASVNVNPRKRCAVIVLCNYRNDDERGEEIRSLCRELLKGLEAQPEKTGLGPQTSGRTETRL